MSAKVEKPRASGAGKVMTSVPGFHLVTDGSKKRKGPVPPEASAAVLVPKLVRALGVAGISRDAVFKGRTKGVYSYSIDPSRRHACRRALGG
jgi:hypothetical protein